MGEILGVKDVATRLGVSPREITRLSYEGELRDDLCPIVSGRRVIPSDYVGQIEAALRRKGHRTNGGEL